MPKNTVSRRFEKVNLGDDFLLISRITVIQGYIATTPVVTKISNTEGKTQRGDPFTIDLDEEVILIR